MHVAFVSPYDPADLRAYSGIPHFMVRALRERVDRVSVVGPLALGAPVRGRLAKLAHRLRGEGYLRSHTWAGARALGEAASRELAALRPDAAVLPSTLPLAALDVDIPTAPWVDATFEANLLFYPSFSDLPEARVAEAHAVEGAALRNASAAVFAGAFAARSAVGYYGVDAGAAHVVPYGANLPPEDVPSAEAVAEAAEARPRDEVRLLFVGGGWYRKGGDVALRVAEAMAARGVPTTLTVAGPVPPVQSPVLRAEGFLRKAVPAEHERLRSLFADSHFLCMPVRAEDFGCVFAEAAAFGLPSASTRIGGVPEAVADGASGVLFEPRESAEAIADRILALWSDRAAYAALCASARTHFDTTVNWGAGTDRVLDLLRAL